MLSALVHRCSSSSSFNQTAHSSTTARQGRAFSSSSSFFLGALSKSLWIFPHSWPSWRVD